MTRASLFRFAFLSVAFFQLFAVSAKAGPFGVFGGYYIYECVNGGDTYQWRYMWKRTKTLPKDPLFCKDDFGYMQCTGGVVDSQGNTVGRGYMCAPEDAGTLAFRAIPVYRFSCLSELVDASSPEEPPKK